MNSDCKAAAVTATGVVNAGPVRIVGLHYVATGVAGSVVLRDGGATGETALSIATPADSAASYIDLGNCPIRCDVDLHATLTAVTAATIVYC